jgi:hypothetical protein
MSSFVYQAFMLTLLAWLTPWRNKIKCYSRGSVVLNILAEVFIPCFWFLVWLYLRPCSSEMSDCLPTTRHYNSDDRTHYCQYGEKNEYEVISKSMMSIKSMSLWEKQSKSYKSQVKVKSLCLTNYALRHEGVRGCACIDPHFLDLGIGWKWVVTFTGGRRASGTHWIEGWVNPGAGLDDVKKILGPTETRTPTPRSSSP